MHLPILLPPNRGCTLCDLHPHAKSPGLEGRHWPSSLPPSHTTPLIYILGQNPGRNEDREARCFIGDSGRVLEEGMLSPYQIEKHASVIFSNTVRCYTLDNAKPKVKAIRSCWPHTLAELSALPRSSLYIVCLGDVALTGLMKYGLRSKSKLSMQGAFSRNLEQMTLLVPGPTPKAKPVDGPPFIFLATYHPAYTFRNPNAALVIDNHMRLLHDHLTGASARKSLPDLQPLRDPIP